MIDLNMDSGFMFLTPNKTEPIDLRTEFCNIITNKYKQSFKPCLLVFESISDLRSDSLNVDFHDVNLEIVIKLKKYIALLSNIIEKFPDDCTTFTWNGDLVNSLIVEKKYALYQLASYFSILSISEINSSSLKKAMVYSQYCAGILSIIIETDPDLVISNLISLVLAQVQELYYLDSVNLKFHDQFLLKLTNQIPIFYSQIDHIGYSDYMKIKQNYFISLTYVLYSQYCSSKNRNSSEFTYLTEAKKIISTIDFDNAKYSKIYQDIENLRLKVGNHLNFLNGTYKIKQLVELPKTVMATPIIPKDIREFKPDTKDFDYLIPLEIIDKILEEELKFKDFINLEIVNPIHVLNEELEQVQTQLNLAEKLAKFKNNENLVPPILLQYRNEICKNGDIEEYINGLFDVLEKHKRDCRLKLDNIWRVLKDELNKEENLAAFHGFEKWTLDVIDKDSNFSVLINSFKIYENYMKQSVSGDELVVVQRNELVPFLKVFQSLESLDDYLPSPNYLAINPELKDLVEDVEEIVDSVKRLEHERKSFLKKIESKQQVKFITLYENNIDDLLKNEILKYSDEVEFVENSKTRQKSIINKLKNMDLKYKQITNQLQESSSRIRVINVLKSTYTGYTEFSINLNQGLEFYKNLNDNINIKAAQLNKLLVKREQVVDELQRSLS